jgi:hypothetical protein
MLIVLIIINILAITAWLYLTGMTFWAFKSLRILRVRQDKKRYFLVKFIVPIFFLSLLYFSLLIIWIVLEYDSVVNPYLSLSWSVFHIITPLIISSQLKHIITKYL